ncbi:MAG TPA: hypothetical protein PKA95_02470 [Thermomicrobiales bacterium]|nr:hypothetical protein [Thermomicrobiales bacterium]
MAARTRRSSWSCRSSGLAKLIGGCCTNGQGSAIRPAGGAFAPATRGGRWHYRCVATLPAGIVLRDLGDHRLPDLASPERVYQVVTTDLSAEFPPLASHEMRSSALPAPTTTLIGRDGEIASIVERLR